MKKIVQLSVLLSMFLLSCSSDDFTKTETEKKGEFSKSTKDVESISFNVLENYFNYEDLDVNLFDYEEDFSEYFGEAGYMGGTPTVVDWSREFVIAVDEPETYYDTKIVPVSLENNNEGQLVFTYKVVKGGLRSNSIKPFIAISVDMQYYVFEDDVLLVKKEDNQTNVSFNVLENYFNYEDLDVNLFNYEEDFSEYFGGAAYMGGTPTIVDWSREFVIAVDEPETYYDTKIVPVSLENNNEGQLEFRYKVVKGKLRSYSIKPFIAISVNMQYYLFEDDDLILIKQN